MNDEPGFVTVFADAKLLVFSKPSGLLSVPGKGADKQDCLSGRVQKHYADALIVHRLDMATSGLMLMARGPAVQTALSKMFEAHDIRKRYIAVVDGKMPTTIQEQKGVWQLIDLPIALDWPNRPLRIIDPAGKPSQTRWRVLHHDAKAGTTRLELEPVTGRSHQLRVHLKALGCPIVGDMLYSAAETAEKPGRMQLHACTLDFVHPSTGAKLLFESPVPF